MSIEANKALVKPLTGLSFAVIRSYRAIIRNLLAQGLVPSEVHAAMLMAATDHPACAGSNGSLLAN